MPLLNTRTHANIHTHIMTASPDCKTSILNLTPHAIHLYCNKTVVLMIEPHGSTARMIEQRPILPNLSTSCLFNLPVSASPVFIDVSNLPTELDDGKKVILVSMPVGHFLRDHPEIWKGPVIGPDTGPGPMGAVRDEFGNIIGCSSFVLYK
jgi:hypothetical protein